jgi:hypothetical protein
MAGEPEDLDKLFESVADGESVDWDKLEREAPDEESRAIIRQLRLISEVAEVHRSQVDEVALAEDVAPTAPVPGVETLPIQPSEGRRVWADLAATTGGGPGGIPPLGAPPTHLGVWGHLLLVRKIGEGSFGEVFQAHDTWLDHPVALKLLKPEAESRVPPAQLLHEARKLARVRHINVVTVHGADRHNGRVGFWMDFVDGETLAARVQRGRLSDGEAISVGREVCRALAAVHQARLIHRDVKAQNVMRAHDGGRIILMDFGAGEFVGDPLDARAQGTPLYLAPELLRGGGAGVRTDIYAVGVLLYHLVTGRFPVEGVSPAALVDAHSRGERRRLRDERPDLSESFIAIVERAIDPDPQRRYASAGDMEAKLAGEPITGPQPGPPRPKSASPPRTTGIIKHALAATAVVAALIGALGFIAARFFEVTLRIDRAFSSGVADILALGASALLPFGVMWLVGGAVLAGLTGMALLLRSVLSAPAKWLVQRARRWDPATTAAVIVVSSVAWWLVVNFVLFAAYLTPVADLASDIETSTDLTILGSAHRGVHRLHYFVSAYSSMLLGLIVWFWFPDLERRSSKSPTIWLWKLAAIAVSFAFLAWATLPRRLVWERFPVVEFENRSGLVIGSAGNELLVFNPDEAGRPRRRVRSDRQDLERAGETRFLFDPGSSK